jgi:hypothetical protein
MQTTIDNRLRLLTGKPIEIDDFGYIYPLTLGQIVDKNYMDYIQYLNVFCFKKEQFMEKPPEELLIFDFLMLAEDEYVHELLGKSLEFFLQEKITIIKEKFLIAVGSTKENLKFINRKNFEDICYVIQIQNYMRSIDDDIDVFQKNDKAKEIQSKLHHSREEIKRLKNKENENIESDFYDLLSALSVKGNINKKDLLNYTMFQIYDDYKRLMHIDQYDTNILALMQGAKNVKLKHWSSKIKY